MKPEHEPSTAGYYRPKYYGYKPKRLTLGKIVGLAFVGATAVFVLFVTLSDWWVK